jgi:lipoprotein-anchoring transpeptidase ErfK/SrfK
MSWRKTLRGIALTGLCGLVILELLGFVIAARHSESPAASARPTDRGAWRSRVRILKARLAALAPEGAFAVVDTASNTLTLRQGERVLRTAIVSAGSGSVLRDPAGQRHWVFDTPHGIRTVLSKITHPVWVKPDWAFIEEGASAPVQYTDRLEPGSMGDYAIGLGDGYFIHGTLYTRLLGRNVTHGCVRVGDQDLKTVFQALSMGSRVILF